MTTMEELQNMFDGKLMEILKDEPYETATKLRVQRLWNVYFRNCKPLQMPKLYIYFMRNEAVNSIRNLLIEVAKHNEYVYSNFEKCSIQEYGDVNFDERLDGFCLAGGTTEDYLIYVTKGTRESEDKIIWHELGHVLEREMQRLIDCGKIGYVKNESGNMDLSKPFLVHKPVE